MSLYRLGGNELFYVDEIPCDGQYAAALQPATYYLRVHWGIYKNTLGTYQIYLNSYSGPGSVALVLGRTSSNNKIAYVTNYGDLWVNGTRICSNFAGASFSKEVNGSLVQKSVQIRSHSALTKAKFGRYSSSLIGQNIYNALKVQPIGNASLSWTLHTRDNTSSGWTTSLNDVIPFSAEAYDTWFIFDLDDGGALKDCTSLMNLFYNPDQFHVLYQTTDFDARNWIIGKWTPAYYSTFYEE
jgi:hypothetical protein